MYLFVKKVRLLLNLRGGNNLGLVGVGHRNNLDILRLIAASLVIVGHSYTTFGPQGSRDFLNLFYPKLAAATFGVQIFFFISGYLVTQSYCLSKSSIYFLASRCLRIFPGLIVSVAITILMCSYATDLTFDNYLFDELTRSYFFNNSTLNIQYNLPGVFLNNDYPNIVNASLWTLPVEFKLYIFLMLIGLTGVLYNHQLANAMALVIILVFTAKGGAYLISNGEPGINLLMFYFGMGALCYVNRNRVLLSVKLLILLVFLNFAIENTIPNSLSILPIVVGYSILVFSFHPSFQINKKLPIDCSYGLYIYAFPIQQFIESKNIFQSFWFYNIFSYLIILIVAVLSWYFVERPALYAKKFFK